MAFCRGRVWRRKTPAQQTGAALTRFSVQAQFAGCEARFF